MTLKKQVQIGTVIGSILFVVLTGTYLYKTARVEPMGSKPTPEITLKADKTDVIKYQRITKLEKFTTTTTIPAKTTVKYLYKSEVEVPQQTHIGLPEIMEMRTESSITVQKPEGHYASKIFVDSEPFYKENETWYQTEIDEVPEDVFDEAMKVTWWEKLIGRDVHAEEDDILVGAGDGTVGMDNEASWDTAHDATTGETSRATETEETMGYCFNNGGNYYIYRSTFPVPSGATITGGAFILSASLNMYVFHINDGAEAEDYEVLVESTQSDETGLSTADYNQFGATNDPDEVSSRVDLGDVVDDSFNAWTLTDLSVVKTNGDASSCGSNTGWTCLGMRIGFDVEDTPCGAGEHRIVIRTSEYTGTASDPYLTVEWTMTPPVTGASSGAKFLQGIGF